MERDIRSNIISLRLSDEELDVLLTCYEYANKQRLSKSQIIRNAMLDTLHNDYILAKKIIKEEREKEKRKKLIANNEGELTKKLNNILGVDI